MLALAYILVARSLVVVPALTPLEAEMMMITSRVKALGRD